jgi:hypothetical protein
MMHRNRRTSPLAVWHWQWFPSSSSYREEKMMKPLFCVLLTKNFQICPMKISFILKFYNGENVTSLFMCVSPLRQHVRLQRPEICRDPSAFVVTNWCHKVGHRVIHHHTLLFFPLFFSSTHTHYKTQKKILQAYSPCLIPLLRSLGTRDKLRPSS